MFHYFDDPYAIIVDRDPRDIYLIVKRISYLVGTFIPHDDVRDYVDYYRIIRRHQEDDEKRVLRIRFEDLVYNYDDTVQTIERFLNIRNHDRIGSHFKPEVSITTTNLKRVYPDEAENIAY